MIDLTQIKKVHCIGIGGIGLSAIADILLARGYEVTGSDMNQSAKVEKLMDDGITVYLGHRAKNVEGADLVVYTVALADDNPELVRARELGIPCITRGKMLGLLMRESKTSIAISGTHGKTTTTAMISLVMKHAGLDPTIAVGGNLEELGGNVAVGSDQYFVAEACEYRDSFLELHPNIEVILNVDSDHLDYFKDIEHIVRSFEKFVSLLPEDGLLFAYDANPFVKRVIKGRDNVITFGMSEGCDYSADDLEFNEQGFPGFTVWHRMTKGGRAEQVGKIQLAVPGEHNLLNALVTFAVCDTLGVDREVIISTLETFTGTQRRFDIMGETQSGMRIVDDYAHHPTEIKATLSAASHIEHDKIWCIFQPHTYTRTIALFDEFPEAFLAADKIVFAEIYAAREKNIHKISSRELAQEMRRRYPEKDVYFFESLEEIANFVYNNAGPDDLVLTMGAGDVYKVGEMILEKDGVTRGQRIR
jgi:UDP-N-acetylmuramate--alanine ligase